MSAKVKTVIQCIAVLACIALVSGLLLGAVNIFTYVDPLQSTLDGFREDSGAKGEFTMIVDEKTAVDGSQGSIVYYARSTDGVHAFLASAVSGYGGEFQLYVYIRDGKIYKIVTGTNGDTFVYKLDDADYYSNFIGKDLSSLDTLSVDKVSGATHTSEAVKNAVDAAVKYYNANVAGGENNG